MIALNVGKDTANESQYAARMAFRRVRPATATSLSVNLKALMELAGWNQSELARRSGVSQRHISDILNSRSECTIPVAEELAKAFGLQAWHITMPNLPRDLVNTQSISKLVAAYIGSKPDGRAFLDAAAEREARRKI